MKRRDLVRHMQQHGCFLLREGSEHAIWMNAATNKRVSVPRHREINNFTAVRICQQLDIPSPPQK